MLSWAHSESIKQNVYSLASCSPELMLVLAAAALWTQFCPSCCSSALLFKIPKDMIVLHLNLFLKRGQIDLNHCMEVMLLIWQTEVWWTMQNRTVFIMGPACLHPSSYSYDTQTPKKPSLDHFMDSKINTKRQAYILGKKKMFCCCSSSRMLENKKDFSWQWCGFFYK